MATKHHIADELHFQLRSKAVLQPDEKELYELSQLAGVTMDPQIFKIVMDMLKLNVSPVSLASTLHSVCTPGHGDASFANSSSHASYLHSRRDRPASRERGGGHSTSLPSSDPRAISDGLKKSKSNISSRSLAGSKDPRDSGRTRSSHTSSSSYSSHYRDGGQTDAKTFSRSRSDVQRRQ